MCDYPVNLEVASIIVCNVMLNVGRLEIIEHQRVLQLVQPASEVLLVKLVLNLNIFAFSWNGIKLSNYKDCY